MTISKFQQSTSTAINRTITSKLSDIVSVKDFGAVGDGITDDTTAIQNALNFIKNTGGTLYVPNGTFMVTTLVFQWDTSNKPTINIMGSGTQSTFIKKISGTSTSIFNFTVSALGNGVYSTFSDFTIIGNSCPGITLTKFARMQTRNLRIINCTIGVENIGTLIVDHYNLMLESNAIGYRCRVASGGVNPNLLTFYGGCMLFNTTCGADIGDATGVFFNGTDIELNGTTGDSTTAGVILRSTNGSVASQGNIVFNGSWFEANKGAAQLLVEDATYLSISLRDVPFYTSPSNISVVIGAIRSVLFDNCNSGTFNYTYSIGNTSGVCIRGGSVWTITSTATQSTYENLILSGVFVPFRATGNGLGIYRQNGDRHNSATGNVTAATSSATTLITLAGSGPRMINVFACLGGAGVSYMSNARYAWDGTSSLLRMGGENAANLTLTSSGTNIQVTQISGITQTVFYVADVIGA
jgi:Pectate lyase superfamily protein